MKLYVEFTIAGWSFEFSIGFARSIGWTLDALGDKEFTSIYGHEDEDGNFVPDGVRIENPPE
jgi:hypothetical protein